MFHDQQQLIQALSMSPACLTCNLAILSLFFYFNDIIFSPANVDASVMYRRWKDSKGKDKEYENIIK